MSLQNPKFPSKLKSTEMADETELFYTPVSKVVVFATLLVSVSDLHKGLSSFVFRRRFGYNSKVSSAGVMELVDVVDSKSTAGDSVPVRVRSPAPYRVFLTNLRVG